MAPVSDIDPFMAQVLNEPVQATYGDLKGQGDITGGENVIKASSITLSSTNTIGTPADPVVTIIQPGSVPTDALIEISGEGTYYGIVVIDLSHVPGPGPITLPAELMKSSGGGGFHGIVMINLPSVPMVPKASKPIIRATGQSVLEGVAVVQVNGAISQSPLTVLTSTGGEAAQYNSADVAMAFRPLTPMPKIVYVRETQ
jgi:hypothetical protein